jgi:hypothetical protein
LPTSKSLHRLLLHRVLEWDIDAADDLGSLLYLIREGSCPLTADKIPLLLLNSVRMC